MDESKFDEQYLRKESAFLVSLIRKDLIEAFFKAPGEADALIAEAGVFESLMKHPIGLHDSPRKWSLIVLTRKNDADALTKYMDGERI